jgi:preprotein translocase subunit YajC
MFNALVVLAQEGAKGGGGGGMLDMMFIPIVLIFLFYLIVLRPMNRRQEQERQALLGNLKKNDKVLTSAGIYGTVVSVSENEDEVVVKVDDNVRLKMIKSAIARNLTNEEAAKAAKAAKDEKKDAPKEAVPTPGASSTQITKGK